MTTTRGGSEQVGAGEAGRLRAPPWHALPADEVVRRLASSPGGLAAAEARARLERYGPNALRPPKPTPALRILLAQLRSVVVLLLAAAAVASLVTGDVVDAIAIGAVLVINVVLGFVTELRARRSVEALIGLEVQRATVVRDGAVREVDARELVPGDVIQLEAGQAVPADARLLRSTELRMVEAPLTGESVPVGKRADAVVPDETPLPDRVTMVYKSTAVVAGTARAVVVATGVATEVGRIGELVAAAGEAETPLERRLDALGRRLAVAALGVAVVVAVLDLLKGESLLLVLQTGIAVAVAAVPEGLPAVVTIAMAVGVRRMARRNALVRRLPTVEALGSATVVCTDKTGTLTAGEQTVTSVWVAGHEVRVTGAGYAPVGELVDEEGAPTPEVLAAVRRALRVAALANRADVVETPAGWTPRGDPTEAALLVAARKAGLEREELLRAWPEVAELPFSSERMLMATYHEAEGGRLVALAKGAPARILERCARFAALDGDRPLDEATRKRVEARNALMAARGLRVLALAEGGGGGTSEAELKGLTLLGLVGMIDPPAEGVRETVEQLRGAGIRTVMVTGDQRLTAEAVARELGLLRPGDETLGGAEVDALTDEALRERAERIGVVSRVTAEAKVRLVRAFQQRGNVVAMLGDGINDAAALRTADVGVAMGGRGTDVAKEAAGIVLADDRFQTIAAAVEEGRVVYDNIRKFVFYLFSCNLGEITVLLGAGLAGLPLPLYPLQILWMNIVTDTFPALALALEPGEPDIMRRPPRDPESTILSGRVLKATVAYALLIGAATLAAFLWGLRAYPGHPERAVTLSFMTLALSQILHLGNARSTRRVTGLRRVVANPYALAAVALTVGLQLMTVYLPPLARVLRVETPTPTGWLVVAVTALVPAVVGQIVKGPEPGG